MDEFYHHLELKPQVQVIVDPSQLQAGGDGRLAKQPYNGQVLASLGLQGLKDLIDRTLIMQMATDDGVSPTDQEITAELNDRTKENPNFVRDLTNAGYTLDMVRKELALELAQYNLTTKGITVTDAEVDKYIAEHPKEFIVPETADLTWVLVPDEKTKKLADADLKTGTSFILVAQKYTVAPNSAKMSYKFPENRVPMLVNYSPDLLKAVGSSKDKTFAAEQQQTDWVKFTDGWAKFFVNKRSAERKLPIDDVLKKKVHRALALQRGSQGKDIGARLQEKLKSSKIEIMSDSLRALWERSMEQLQSATASPTSKP